MPLTMVKEGERIQIKKVSGRENVKRHLEGLGFVTGADAMVVSANQGSMIVSVKETRVAISRELANKILVDMEPQIKKNSQEEREYDDAERC